MSSYANEVKPNYGMKPDTLLYNYDMKPDTLLYNYDMKQDTLYNYGIQPDTLLYIWYETRYCHITDMKPYIAV